MLDHVSVNVGDFAKSKAFYDKALAALGLSMVMGDGEFHAGYGNDRPFFWIGQRQGLAGAGAHVAFNARNRAEVDAFYAAAMAAGGIDNGAPGVRDHYHPNYYGAFVVDPDGHNVEAVCHAG